VFRTDPRGEFAYVLRVFNKEDDMQTQQISNGLAITAFWQARDGEADAVANILAQFVPQARREPGVQLFVVHRAKDDDSQFLFYELFDDAAAFEAHQQTPHFKSLILGEGLPRLSKRERVQYDVLG
jgi:quinol monooxygenase YgiN